MLSKLKEFLMNMIPDKNLTFYLVKYILSFK